MGMILRDQNALAESVCNAERDLTQLSANVVICQAGQSCLANAYLAFLALLPPRVRTVLVRLSFRVPEASISGSVKRSVPLVRMPKWAQNGAAVIVNPPTCGLSGNA